MPTFKRLRAAWRPLREARPGKRFEAFHESRKAQRGGRPWRFLFMAGGVTLVLLGLLLVPAPGPGWLVVFAGAGLLAQESLGVARSLDAMELRVRGWIPGGRKARQRR